MCHWFIFFLFILFSSLYWLLLVESRSRFLSCALVNCMILWIYKKFYRYMNKPTSLAPIVEHWSHDLFPIVLTLSLWCLMGEGKVKSPLCVPWGCIYKKWGDPSPPLWLLGYHHDCLTYLWPFDFLHDFSHKWLLDFHFTLCFSNIELHIPQNDVAHDELWHDMTLHY